MGGGFYRRCFLDVDIVRVVVGEGGWVWTVRRVVVGKCLYWVRGREDLRLESFVIEE